MKLDGIMLDLNKMNNSDYMMMYLYSICEKIGKERENMNKYI